MYPLLQQHVMFMNSCCITNQKQQRHVVFRNNCCITNQNQKQQRHVRFRSTCCITNQNQNQNQKQQRQYASTRSKPARDIVIDFGKYKGKMLGSLPSGYLKWVSKNLRTLDFEVWAILADQVLVDPIYKDRIEWEFALNVLSGERSRYRSTEPVDSQLREISERFGWDFLDKVGWSRVDFDLLGTSKGGRIPRLRKPSEAADARLRKPSEAADASQPNLPPATTSVNSSNTSRRMKRREKLKMRSRTTHEAQQQHKDDTVSEQQQQHKDDTGSAADIKKVANPFPGRQALLRKAINYRAQS